MERSEEINKLPDFRDADCFHNGAEVLSAVRDSHKISTTNLRTGDYITKAVVEQMIREMLYDANARPTAFKLWHKSKQIVTEARRELQRANGSPSQDYGTNRSTMNRSRTIPEQRPPAPPHPPPGLGLDIGRFQPHGTRTPSSPSRSSIHRRSNSNHTATSPMLPHEEESQSPEAIFERWDTERADLAEHSPTPSSQMGRANHSAYNRRGGIARRENSRQQTQRGAYSGFQSEISETGTSWEHDRVAMNGGSPRGIRSRNSDYSEVYCPSPVPGRPPSGETHRSESPDEMEEMEITPSTHSRQFSRETLSHSRVSSNNSTLPVVVDAVSPPPAKVETSTPTPQVYSPAPTPAVQNTASNLPQPVTPPPPWSVEEALKWRQEIKDTKIHKSIPNPQLHDRLRDRDHVGYSSPCFDMC
jgi:hypothetical protein